MNPSTGRFISMDAYSGSIFDPMSLHKYLYASGSPTVYCDPTGYSDTTLAGQMTVCGILEVLCGMVVQNMPQFGTTVATILVATDVGYSNGVSDDKLKEILYSEPYNADDAIEEEVENEARPDAKDEKNKTEDNNPNNADDTTDFPDYPGDDPNVSPGEDWEWRGPKDKGSWYNPKTGETLHPDLNHTPPEGPHWDYIPYKNGPQYRLYPDGSFVPK
jgi:hypothetical protein